MAKLKNEVGNKYGRLTVLERAENRGVKVAWLCRCDCGNEVIVRGSDFRSGKTKSCGCYKKEKTSEINFKDLVGSRFGKLTVIERSGHTDYGRIQWLCRCDCGGEIITNSSTLNSGDTKSCGCTRSYAEEFIQLILNENKVDFKKEFKFDDLVSDSNNPLRFDFAIFKNGKLSHLIEYDGIQHYDKSYQWYSETMKKHDERKNKYCEENNIELRRFSHGYSNITIEDLI